MVILKFDSRGVYSPLGSRGSPNIDNAFAGLLIVHLYSMIIPHHPTMMNTDKIDYGSWQQVCNLLFSHNIELRSFDQCTCFLDYKSVCILLVTYTPQNVFSSTYQVGREKQVCTFKIFTLTVIINKVVCCLPQFIDIHT